jgi:hypothetical protein
MRTARRRARSRRAPSRRRTAPGQHGHRDAGVERCAHEPCTRIGDRRHPGVRDERDPLAGCEARQELGDAGGLVVLVVGEKPRLDLVPLEQAARMPRVLGEHDVCLAQLRQDAQGDVVEVADRRRADARGTTDDSPRSATSPAPISPAASPSDASSRSGRAPPAPSASRNTAAAQREEAAGRLRRRSRRRSRPARGRRC